VFCPNCGTKNDDTATTCTKCGFKLGGPAGAKFRGTMMLNTEQSVQGMVDEHRRKLQDAAAAREPAEGPEGASPVPPEAVFKGPQPGAGAPKRRMGTMLGVAPQVGGVRPPHFHGGPTPPLPSAVEPVPDAAGAPSEPNPLGGTVAFAAVPPPAASSEPSPTASPLAAGRTEAFAAPALAPAGNPLAAGRTEAFQAVPPAAAPQGNALTAGRTEAFAAVPEPTPAPLAAVQRGRTEAFDATPPPIERPAIEQPSPEQPAPASSPSAGSYAPAGVPRRLKPLDVFLIVITLGLYALVLRARQGKAIS
jgi:hypothetical protein